MSYVYTRSTVQMNTQSRVRGIHGKYKDQKLYGENAYNFNFVFLLKIG